MSDMTWVSAVCYRGNPYHGTGGVTKIASNVCAVAHTNFQGFENTFGKSPKPS